MLHPPEHPPGYATDKGDTACATNYAKFSIIDVDECQGTTPCGQLCMNTDGSYECGCTSGYELQQDEQTCEGQ